MGERAVGDDQPVIGGGERHEILIRAALGEAVLDLVAHDGRTERTLRTLPSIEGVVADADITDDAVALQLTHPVHRRAIGHQWVRLVHLVQVDGVDLQPAGAAPGPVDNHRGDGQQRPDLGGDERFPPAPGDRTPDDIRSDWPNP